MSPPKKAFAYPGGGPPPGMPLPPGMPQQEELRIEGDVVIIVQRLSVASGWSRSQIFNDLIRFANYVLEVERLTGIYAKVGQYVQTGRRMPPGLFLPHEEPVGAAPPPSEKKVEDQGKMTDEEYEAWMAENRRLALEGQKKPPPEEGKQQE